ncbi:MAG: DNA-protecting protein DprA [Alphaproteobacteria bacterium]|nr:DNA-protecting protein DprA [Alphaproteobacteria bacterium]
MDGVKVALTDEQKLDWLQLIRSTQIGPKIFHMLINKYGGAGNAIAALPEFIAQTNNKKIKLANRDTVLYEWQNIQKFGAKLIALGEDDYPDALKYSANPPPLLTVKGDISQLRKPALSIVGTRNCSALGLKLTQKLATDVGAEGFTIVSGFARGIDTKAHIAALNTGTIACLAGGINIIYPPENDKLYQDFLTHKGLFISEMPFSLTPKATHFPRRNRIIAGIAHATLVIEAAIKSGSLITANMAADLGREILAVPGNPLDPRAAGPNSLLKNGAILVRHKDDVLDALAFVKNNQKTSYENIKEVEVNIQQEDLFSLQPVTRKMQEISNKPEDVIMQLLTTSPIEMDYLLRETKLNTEKFHNALLNLELDEKIEQIYGQGVQLRS